MKTTPRKTVELVAALRSLNRRVLAERGLVSSASYLLADDASTVCYEERWESRQDLEDQIRSPRYKHLLALMETATEPPLLEFRFISETRGLEYVAAVRGEK